MRANGFKVGKFYSRRNYEQGLTVRANKDGGYGYFENGTLVSRVKAESSVHKLNDFYESDKEGLPLPKVGLVHTFQDTHGFFMGMDLGRGDTAVISTPSGDNPIFRKFMDESEEALHGANTINLNGEDDMSRFENGIVDKTVNNVKQETTDVAMITIGKLIYVNGGEIVARFVPKLKWYEKLLTSSKKRELALLIGTYVAIKAVQSKYDHYLLSSVSAYINFQLQTELLGGVTQETLDKIFSRFEETQEQ